MARRFEELIERHHDEILAYLWRLLGGVRHSDVTLDAEDLVQEVFMRGYEAHRRLPQDSNHKAWLYKIATNCAMTKLKQAKRRRETSALLKREANAPNVAAEPGGEPAQLQWAVDQLSPKQKACVSLRYFNDLDYPEIAEIVGCTAQSARANVSQAVRRLRRALKESR